MIFFVSIVDFRKKKNLFSNLSEIGFNPDYYTGILHVFYGLNHHFITYKRHYLTLSCSTHLSYHVQEWIDFFYLPFAGMSAWWIENEIENMWNMRENSFEQ